MKEENIDKAKKITESLSYLRNQVVYWNECVKFSSGLINGTTEKNRDYQLSSSYLNFEVCKALALVGIQKRIKELEAELETL